MTISLFAPLGAALGFLIGTQARQIFAIAVFLIALAVMLLVVRQPDPLPGVLVLGLGLSTMSGWLFRVIVSDVYAVFRKLGVLHAIKLALWAFVITLPLIVLAAIGFDFGDTRERLVLYGCGSEQGGIYAIEAEKEDVFSVPAQNGRHYVLSRSAPEKTHGSALSLPLISGLLCPAPPYAYDLELSAYDSISVYVQRLKEKLQAKVDSAIQVVEETGLAGKEATAKALFGDGNSQCSPAPEEVFPETLRCRFQVPAACKFYRWPFNIGECASIEVKRAVQMPLHAAYENQRDEFKNNWEHNANHFQAQAENLGKSTRLGTNVFLNRHLNPIEAKAKQSVYWTFVFWTGLRWTGIVLILFALLKFYLYIFARLVFAPGGGGLYLNMEHMDGAVSPPVCAPLSSEKRTIKIELKGETWYAARRSAINWDDHQRVSWIFRPSQLFFSRLLARKLSWYVYEGTDPEEVILGRHGHDFDVAKITLPEGAGFIFQPSRLEAFSDGIHFRRLFSARLTAFLQRRLVYAEASGPGTLILSGMGGTLWAVGNSESEATAVPPEDIIGMDAQGSFGCNSQTDPLSLLLEPFTIKPQRPLKDLIVAHKPPENAVRSIGKFLRKCMFFLFG
ncbi:hypothetical protein [Flexibacterium corallicola]|uniref:hypothetical protein n=1 Tax=Flexibacterium corallicola TaxID=3037259 RepID=UPI00286F4F44|nr:hypothetical protein [Pseudovibrio sp. M1P-2-3]